MYPMATGNIMFTVFPRRARLKQTWGGEGSEPGRFSLPHNVYVSKDERIIVADREPNHRIQVFDLDGTFLAEWPGRPAPCGLFIDDDNMVYIAEGAGVSILTMDGRLIAQWVVTGGPNDRPHGAHGIWVDSQGSDPQLPPPLCFPRSVRKGGDS